MSDTHALTKRALPLAWAIAAATANVWLPTETAPQSQAPAGDVLPQALYDFPSVLRVFVCVISQKDCAPCPRFPF